MILPCPDCHDLALEVEIVTELGHGANRDGDYGRDVAYPVIVAQLCDCPVEVDEVHEAAMAGRYDGGY